MNTIKIYNPEQKGITEGQIYKVKFDSNEGRDIAILEEMN